MKRGRWAVLIGALMTAGVLTAVAAERGVSFRGQTNEAANTLAKGDTFFVELDSTLDSKKAKVGDPVVAHTTEAVKENGKIVVPKNAKLMGSIVQSSARSRGDSGSVLAMQFDKLAIKKGQEIPLKTIIQAVAAAPRYVSEQGMTPDAITNGSAAAQGSPMAVPHIAPNGSSTTVAGAPNPTGNGSNSGSANGSASNGGASESNKPAANSSGGGLDAEGRLTASSRGVFGLEDLHLRTSDESGAAQGSLLTSSGKSVHLDGGVRMILVSQ
jgi:hypothetical protein